MKRSIFTVVLLIISTTLFLQCSTDEIVDERQQAIESAKKSFKGSSKELTGLLCGYSEQNSVGEYNFIVYEYNGCYYDHAWYTNIQGSESPGDDCMNYAEAVETCKSNQCLTDI